MKAPVGSKTDFIIVPSGSFPAILTQLVDLGTQEGTYEGKPTYRRKVRLTFELHGEEVAMEDGKPMVIGRDFTLSSHENAALREFIEGWRGKKFTDEEAEGFDYQLMIGKPCLLNVTHTETQGKKYANINAAMRLPSGMTAPTQVNPSIYFYLEEYDQDTFEKLPEWLQTKISKSPEFKDATGFSKSSQIIVTNAPFNDYTPF